MVVAYSHVSGLGACQNPWRDRLASGRSKGPFLIDQFLPVLLAPFIGSFLGVLVRRLPDGRPVAWARSRCEACGAPLSWHDLVPLVSYFWLRGRCRLCGAPIDKSHLAIELAAILVAAWAVLAAAGPAWAAAGAVLGWTLLALAWIDAAHLRLPDILTLPLIPAGLAATWLLEPWALLDHTAGAAVGYLSFRLLSASYHKWRGQEGLGEGDAKLLAAAGAWVGLGALPVVVFVAAMSGIAFLLHRRIRGVPLDHHAMIPFGPFLALGIWLVRMHGASLPV